MGDEDHLVAASSTGRILFTYNTADYCALHQRWISLKRSHAGIIVARQQQYSVGEELRRIMQLISRRTAEQMQNRLEFVSSWAALSRFRPCDDLRRSCKSDENKSWTIGWRDAIGKVMRSPGPSLHARAGMSIATRSTRPPSSICFRM